MLYVTVMSAPLPRWVLYFSYLPVDPNFPMFITVRSRASAEASPEERMIPGSPDCPSLLGFGIYAFCFDI